MMSREKPLGSSLFVEELMATLTYHQAAEKLGRTYSHVLRLVAHGALEKTKGGVTDTSVEELIEMAIPPKGYITSRAAAAILGIKERQIGQVVAAELIPKMDAWPRGYWFKKTDVAKLGKTPELLAKANIMVKPPKGYLTTRQTMKLLRLGPSTVAKLGKSGKLERLKMGVHNTWYREVSVRQHLARRRGVKVDS
jgi:hypothetical protein